MQDHEIQPYITVMEAMHFSANLKTGSEISQVDKKIRVSVYTMHFLFLDYILDYIFNAVYSFIFINIKL